MSEIRKLVAFAISDPGHAGEGYKGDRSLTEWQTDAVWRVVSELEKANVAYVDANTSLIARIAALEKERDEMAGWIKDCTTTISDAIGGGSEMFIRKGEAYRIDPRFVANYIETRRGDLHEARVTIVKLRKEAAR